MKYSIGILTTVIFSAALILTGCDNPSDRSNQLQDAETSVIESNRDLEIAKAEVEAEYRIFKTENENRIAENNRKIEEIKEEISNESDAEVKARHQENLQEHEATQRELEREMDNYRVSGRENWNNFKNNFSNRMDDLGDSLDDFFSTTTTASSRRQP